MAAGSDTLLRYIRGLVLRPQSDETTDAALLSRFISARDERAFAALVDRHAPLVLHVCRRVLGDIQDAEDAVQATFLILARKAASVRPRDMLPAWLHVVARRVAIRARSAKTRQFRATGHLVVPVVDPRPDPLADLSARELLGIIDDELSRLSAAYRLPVILCCLEGRSVEEAARQLGWTAGSVKGRLERGRARLHNRLVRRGLTLSAALAAAEASRGVTSAAELERLAAATVRGAVAFAARSTAVRDVSPAAVALAGEVIKAMAIARLTVLAALLLAAILLIAVTGLLALGISKQKADQLAQEIAPSTELTGNLNVFIWKKTDPSKRLDLGTTGALPLRAGDWMRIEAETDRPAYMYVIYLDAQGEATPLFPWRKDDWNERPAEQKRSRLSVPEDPLKDGAPLTPGPSGIEAVLLLARDEPLSAEEVWQLRRLFDKAPPGKFDPLHGAVWLGTEERFGNLHDRARPNLDQSGTVLDPVERLRRLVRGELKNLGGEVRGVCYPFDGN